MKTALSILALTLAMSSSEANFTKCTNADGSLTFKLVRLGGGVSPLPGMLLSVATRTYSGKAVFKQLNYASCELENCPPTEPNQIDEDLVTEFFGNATVLSKSDVGYKIEVKYLESARIFRVSGKPIFEGEELKHFEDFLLCHSVVVFYP